MRMLACRLVIPFVLLAPAAASAQADAPTREPSAVTAEQETILREGIDFHDKGEFDQAIAKYEQVLAKSPDSVAALFELAYSYLSKRDFDRAFATAQRGAGYRSDLLPMFYDLMASSLDSKGQPEQAIEVYRKGIAISPQSSQLYFNMAVTYRESLNRPDEARAALEKAAGLEPLQPGAHLLLGQVFQASGYPAPAFLALSTYLMLDPAGRQTLPGYGLWRAVLKGSVDPIPDGTAPPDAATRAMMTRPPSKTDQGDFTSVDAQLGPSYAAFNRRMDNGEPEIQALIAQVDQLLAALPADATGPAAGSFANRHYRPFFVALKQRGYVEPFVYWASQRAPVPGVVEWLKANEPRVREFLGWASAYSWPTP